MLEDKLISVETFRKLKYLEKQYLKLPYLDFPCEGALSAWKFLTKILSILLKRFKSYSNRQLKLIQTLIPLMESFCGYLDDSKTKNVPWSIIPSLEELFSAIKTNTQFVICPIWEHNYKIYNRNIIEYLDSKLLRVPGLIFDSTDRLDEERKHFLDNYPAGIYFVFYPRTEKLTTLHFPLLGHEIGHIFASEWIDDNFQKLLEKHDINNQLRKYLENKLPNGLVGPLFKSQVIDTHRLSVINTYKMIVSEILADIAGAYIFGHSALLSNFVFSLRFNLDDFRDVPKGYISWRLRLYFIQKTMEDMGLEEFRGAIKGSINWYDDIKKITGSVDLKKFDFEATHYGVVKYIVLLLENEFDDICKEVVKFLKKQKYQDVYCEHLQQLVVKRLSDGLIPNCEIGNDLKETPIDLRNIVGGTWLYLFNKDINKYYDFYDENHMANLLSLKAIELSHYQKKFQEK